MHKEIKYCREGPKMDSTTDSPLHGLRHGHNALRRVYKKWPVMSLTTSTTWWWRQRVSKCWIQMLHTPMQSSHSGKDIKATCHHNSCSLWTIWHTHINDCSVQEWFGALKEWSKVFKPRTFMYIVITKNSSWYNHYKQCYGFTVMQNFVQQALLWQRISKSDVKSHKKLESTDAQVEPPKTAVPSGSWVGMSKTHLTPK